MYIKISEKHSIIPEYLTLGKIYKVEDGHYTDDDGDQVIYMGGLYCHHINGYWEIVTYFENRDFVSLNSIKTTMVSKQLGYSRNWLMKGDI